MNLLDLLQGKKPAKSTPLPSRQTQGNTLLRAANQGTQQPVAQPIHPNFTYKPLDARNDSLFDFTSQTPPVYHDALGTGKTTIRNVNGQNVLEDAGGVPIRPTNLPVGAQYVSPLVRQIKQNRRFTI